MGVKMLTSWFSPVLESIFFLSTIIMAFTNVTYMLNTIQKKVRLHNIKKINCILYLASFVNKLTHFLKPSYSFRTSDVIVVSFFVIISNLFYPIFFKHFISSILLLDRATDSVIVSLCSNSFHLNEHI